MVGDGGDPAEQRVGIALRYLVLGDQPPECLADPGLAGFGAGDVDVRQQHIVAGACRYLRDPRAHLPCPDNADDHDMPFRWKSQLCP